MGGGGRGHAQAAPEQPGRTGYGVRGRRGPGGCGFRQSRYAQDSMISRAMEMLPGSSSRDCDSLPSPLRQCRAHLRPGEPGRLGDLAVVVGELLLRITQGVKPTMSERRNGHG